MNIDTTLNRIAHKPAANRVAATKSEANQGEGNKLVPDQVRISAVAKHRVEIQHGVNRVQPNPPAARRLDISA